MKCKQTGCVEAIAVYGRPGEVNKFCAKHKEPDMIHIDSAHCAIATCQKTKPKWRRPGDEYMRYCATCRLSDPTMYNPTIPQCSIEGCNEHGKNKDGIDETILYCINHKHLKRAKQKRPCKFAGAECGSKTAIYGYPDDPDKKKFCSEHYLEGMINVVSKRCEHIDKDTKEKCQSINPSFGYWGEKERPFCNAHALPGMLNLSTHRCDNIDDDGVQCMTTGTIGRPEDNKVRGVRKILYCKAHSDPSMRNLLTTNKCEFPDCPKQKSFGVIDANGKKIITHCWDHADHTRMTNLHKRTCKYEPEKGEEACDTTPVFGLPGEQPTSCRKHATDEMEDVVNTKCTECSTTASFGDPDERLMIRCGTHADRSYMIELKHKKCKDCDKRAAWGLPNETITHCGGCANKDTMTDLTNRRCADDGCSKFATYNVPGEQPKFCQTHSDDAMINVKASYCADCKDIQINGHYDDLCFGCYAKIHKDEPRIKNYRVKENQIIGDLRERFPSIIQNSAIKGGTSKRRPDGLIRVDGCDHNIIIEIDENQHKSMDNYSDEEERIQQIYEDLGSAPLVVIRFNPDKYDKHPSLFITSKVDRKVRIRCEKVYETEIKKLFDMVEYYINCDNLSGLKVETLRYNTA